MSIVPQVDLETYLNLMEAGRHRADLRRRLLASFDAGAVVEAGPLVLTVRQAVRRPLGRAVLIQLLGEARVHALLAEVEPVTVRVLTVKPREIDRPSFARRRRPGSGPTIFTTGFEEP